MNSVPAAADSNSHVRSGRLEVIDSLRGAALFGVLFVNMLWFAGFENTLNAAQTSALVSSALDHAVEYFLDIFVFAKSIGIFTFLFGIGFWMQRESLERRDPDAAAAIHRRRMSGLMMIGLAHWVLWSGEILHIYALAGFCLMGIRKWRTGWLLIAGLSLAIFSRPLLGRVLAVMAEYVGTDGSYGDAVLGQRFAVFMHGGIADIVHIQLAQDVWPQILSGFWITASAHALGRFMVGVVVAKGRYLQSAAQYKRPLMLLLTATLPIGFVAQKDWVLTNALNDLGVLTNSELLAIVGHICNSIGVTAMTAAYVAAFLLAWEVSLLRKVIGLLAPVGRMALTNYLLHTPINYLLFCGFGLGLMGKVGLTGCLLLSIALFCAQVLISHAWLARFSMGPMEWGWRWWTYQRVPRAAVA